MMKGRLLPLLTGALFALGLAISGMTQPAKVIGFLDFFGSWDPSLALVMAGAVGVYLLTNRGLVARMKKPVSAERFSIPTRRDIDRRLVVGAAIFGVGWGLSGFCPGPALVSLGAGTPATWWFVPGVIIGMAVFHKVFPDRAGGDG